MVTSVFNAAQYVKIVSCEEFTAAIADYLGCNEADMQDQENENYAQFENINFYSTFLSDFIKRK